MVMLITFLLPILLDNLEKEIAILMDYLPAQLSEEELRAIIAEAVIVTQATQQKDMGKVMAVLLPQVKGRADGKMVSTIVKEFLA